MSILLSLVKIGGTIQKYMFIRKKHSSDNVGVIVVEKSYGKMKEFVSIGIARNQDKIASFMTQVRE